VSGAAFTITRDTIDSNPNLPRQRLRNVGVETIAELDGGPGKIVSTEGYLRFPDDAVLLMIGNTPELLAACQAAADAGILMIGTESDHELYLLFARIDVSLVQDDTILAVGSVNGTMPAPQRQQWRGVTVRPNITWVTTQSDGADPHQSRALPVIINEIKRTTPSGYIKTS
jgi:hypothetical protein